MNGSDFPEGVAWLAGSPVAGRIPVRVAVAWSGGIDSTALLLALRYAGHEVRAWHVDHGWSPQSSDHCRQLQSQAERWGIPFRAIRLREQWGRNREAHARYSRYRELYRMFREQGDVEALCLAHHRDDQAETVCMRLLAGAGVAGCRGMAARRQWRDMTMLRPLLHLPKATLAEAVRKHGIAWIEDRSNSDTSLWRNHIRHILFPAMRVAGVEPEQLFLRWQAQAARLSLLLEEAAGSVAVQQEDDGCSVSWAGWRNLPAAVRAWILQQMAAAAFGEGAVFGRRHLQAVERWLAEGGSGGVDLSRSRLMRKDGRLRLRVRQDRQSLE